MARPLKIYNNAGIVGLREMSDADLDYVAHTIGSKLAAETDGTGVLTLNVNGASGTAIGSFSDTYRPDAVGSHPVGTTVTTVTYTFKQQRTTTTSTLVRPLEWSSSAIRESADSELNSYIFPRVAARLASATLGSYVLQPTAPATGTWTASATITNTYNSGSSSNTTKLWRCTSYAAPTAVRPVKVFGTGMKEMSDTELEGLYGAYTSYVSSTGVGQYLAQSATPTPGTWVRMGSAFTDTRQIVSNVGYTGNYTSSYGIGYAGSRQKGYAGTRGYAGSRQKTYSRSYSGYTRANYTGTYSATYVSAEATYTGTYSTTYIINYAGSRDKSYTGATVSASTENVSNVSLWLRTA